VTDPIFVTDPGDPALDDYRHLSDPARRIRTERDSGFFIAEGVTVIERLLGSDLDIRSVLLTPKLHRRLLHRVEQLSAPVFVADREIVATIVGFDLHRGAVAAVNRPIQPTVDELLGRARLVCALEALVDHENVGAIIRSAVALGVDGLLLDPTCADPWYRRSVRVSMGAIFDLPVARSSDWPGDLDIARARGFDVLAMTVGPGTVPLSDVVVGPRTVVVLGSEGHGLENETVAASDMEVTIPIRSMVDSLNVGHAAAVAFHLLGRVRDEAPHI
jgi:tRNA G18 (ribose-2'-O)-methylase SpoU